MKLLKEENSTKLERKDWNTKNLITLIGAMVNLFMATRVKREYWLTDKEYLFFICCVLIVNEDVPSYISSRARSIYRGVMNITRLSDITGFLNRLSKKGWLEYDKKEKRITIPSFFTEINLHSHKVGVEVEINYDYDETI